MDKSKARFLDAQFVATDRQQINTLAHALAIYDEKDDNTQQILMITFQLFFKRAHDAATFWNQVNKIYSLIVTGNCFPALDLLMMHLATSKSDHQFQFSNYDVGNVLKIFADWALHHKNFKFLLHLVKNTEPATRNDRTYEFTQLLLYRANYVLYKAIEALQTAEGQESRELLLGLARTVIDHHYRHGTPDNKPSFITVLFNCLKANKLSKQELINLFDGLYQTSKRQREKKYPFESHIIISTDDLVLALKTDREIARTIFIYASWHTYIYVPCVEPGNPWQDTLEMLDFYQSINFKVTSRENDYQLENGSHLMRDLINQYAKEEKDSPKKLKIKNYIEELIKDGLKILPQDLELALALKIDMSEFMLKNGVLAHHNFKDCPNLIRRMWGYNLLVKPVLENSDFINQGLLDNRRPIVFILSLYPNELNKTQLLAIIKKISSKLILSNEDLAAAIKLDDMDILTGILACNQSNITNKGNFILQAAELGNKNAVLLLLHCGYTLTADTFRRGVHSPVLDRAAKERDLRCVQTLLAVTRLVDQDTLKAAKQNARNPRVFEFLNAVVLILKFKKDKKENKENAANKLAREEQIELYALLKKSHPDALLALLGKQTCNEAEEVLQAREQEAANLKKAEQARLQAEAKVYATQYGTSELKDSGPAMPASDREGAIDSKPMAAINPGLEGVSAQAVAAANNTPAVTERKSTPVPAQQGDAATVLNANSQAVEHKKVVFDSEQPGAGDAPVQPAQPEVKLNPPTAGFFSTCCH